MTVSIVLLQSHVYTYRKQNFDLPQVWPFNSPNFGLINTPKVQNNVTCLLHLETLVRCYNEQKYAIYILQKQNYTAM